MEVRQTDINHAIRIGLDQTANHASHHIRGCGCDVEEAAKNAAYALAAILRAR